MATQNSDDRSKPIAATQGGTSQSTYTTGDTLYASGANTLSKLTIGSSTQVLGVTGGVPAWEARFSGSPVTGNTLIYNSAGNWVVWDNSKYAYIFEDFIVAPLTNTTQAWPWYRAVTGSGSQAIGISSVVNHPGIVQCETGTTTTGQAGVHCASYIATGSDLIRFEALVRFPNLATAAQEYDCWIGIHDALAGVTSITNGIYFEYDRNNSTNWRGCCTSASATTRSTGTNVAVASNTWQHLVFEVNAAASSVAFSVDGTDIGSVTGNIPTSGYQISMYIKKTAGSTERTAQVDFIKYYSELGTDRF